MRRTDDKASLVWPLDAAARLAVVRGKSGRSYKGCALFRADAQGLPDDNLKKEIAAKNERPSQVDGRTANQEGEMSEFRLRRVPIVRAALALVAAVAFAGAAAAQTATGDPTATAAAETSSKLSFHAYINQAYARSDDHQVYGVPTDGTTNYSSIAVQFRYQMTPDDQVAVQFGHDRLGKSTLNKETEDIALDWAFYQRRLNDTTTVKVGRVQLPLGIYNEVQDVGTVLPFYTAPQSVYVKTRTAESVDGVVLSHTFAEKSQWSLEADVDGGSWDRNEQSPGTGAVAEAR